MVNTKILLISDKKLTGSNLGDIADQALQKRKIASVMKHPILPDRDGRICKDYDTYDAIVQKFSQTVNCTNEEQREFLDRFQILYDKIYNSKIKPKFETYAFSNNEMLNSIMQSHEIQSYFYPLEKKEVGLLVLKYYMCMFKNPMFCVNGDNCNSVFVPADSLTKYVISGSEKTLYRFAMNKGDNMFIYPLSSETMLPKSEFEIFAQIRALQKRKRKILDALNLTMPLVEFQIKDKMKWVRGLYNEHGDFIIDSLRYVIFSMGKFSSIDVEKVEGETESVQTPFYMWVERRGYDYPVFAMIVTEDLINGNRSNEQKVSCSCSV